MSKAGPTAGFKSFGPRGETTPAGKLEVEHTTKEPEIERKEHSRGVGRASLRGPIVPSHRRSCRLPALWHCSQRPKLPTQLDRSSHTRFRHAKRSPGTGHKAGRRGQGLSSVPVNGECAACGLTRGVIGTEKRPACSVQSPKGNAAVGTSTLSAPTE
jgi:hypothetical protein